MHVRLLFLLKQVQVINDILLLSMQILRNLFIAFDVQLSRIVDLAVDSEEVPYR